MLYAALVGLLAFSPLLSLVVSDALGYPATDVDWVRFLWVGPALSLPVTLTIARFVGREEHCAYWDYLKSFRANSTKASIITAWAIVTVVMVAIGIALTR